MRIVIFGIKDDSLTSEEIKRSLSKAFPNECGNIVAIEEGYIAGKEDCESHDSAFIEACKNSVLYAVILLKKRHSEVHSGKHFLLIRLLSLLSLKQLLLVHDQQENIMH